MLSWRKTLWRSEEVGGGYLMAWLVIALFQMCWSQNRLALVSCGDEPMTPYPFLRREEKQ